jgi:chromosome segregation ATPase
VTWDHTRELVELEEEERALSARRRRLHDRIDFLRGGAVSDEDPGLAELTAEEREVSRRRREVHARIDEIRAAAGEAQPEPALGREMPPE